MSSNNSDIDSSNSNSNTIDNPIQQYNHVDISTAKDLKSRSSSPRLSDISNKKCQYFSNNLMMKTTIC